MRAPRWRGQDPLLWERGEAMPALQSSLTFFLFWLKSPGSVISAVSQNINIAGTCWLGNNKILSLSKTLSLLKSCFTNRTPREMSWSTRDSWTYLVSQGQDFLDSFLGISRSLSRKFRKCSSSVAQILLIPHWPGITYCCAFNFALSSGGYFIHVNV